MQKNTKDFFVKKKEWSEVKDALLECYLKPYFTKILHTYKPINYVDCFAGQGKFDDGKPGSPILALNIIAGCMKSVKSKKRFSFPKVHKYFIERDYADALKENLKGYRNVSVLEGTYQERIREILEHKTNENVFLYVDPFGIKCLDFNLYDYYKNSNFSTIELLINFNSFGFIREACRVKKKENANISEIDSIINNIGGLGTLVESEQELNNIAGGDYWVQIIEEFYQDKITCYEAEKKFSEMYCNKLKERFKYVVNMPIRLKAGQQPKYRMIHVTNNEDGCLLMVQNICNRWKNLSSIQIKNSAPSLFEENIENEIIDESYTRGIILEQLKKYTTPIHMNNFLSELFTNQGIFTTWAILQKTIRAMEKSGEIYLRRNPEFTNTGKKATFINESKKENHSVEIWIQK